MNTREEILTKLRTTLNQPTLRFPPANPKPLTDATRMAVTHAAGGQWDLAQRFSSELSKIHGSAEIFETVAEARMAVVSKVLVWIEEEEQERRGPAVQTGRERHILTWAADEIGLPGLSEMLTDMNFHAVTPSDLRVEKERSDIRHIRFGITGVMAAFASTGSMMMATGPGCSRVASLLPYRHIALIPFTRLFPTIEAWLAHHRVDGHLSAELRSHANFSMITGPSKSADIEGNLTLGVHGPKYVHAVLFDDVTD